MLPSGSHATLDTWPSVQPFGICGQDGSTTNFGTSTSDAGRGGAAEAWCDPITNDTTAIKTMPALTQNFRLAFTILILLFFSSWGIVRLSYPWHNEFAICAGMGQPTMM